MIAPVLLRKPFDPNRPRYLYTESNRSQMKKSGPSKRKPTQALTSALKIEHTPHGLGAVPPPIVIVPSMKPSKPFSTSRDLREDRGERQMKTVKNTQTLPHANWLHAK